MNTSVVPAPVANALGSEPLVSEPLVSLVEPIIADAPTVARPHVARRAEARRIEFPGEDALMLLDSSHTAGALMVGAFEAGPDTGPPIHRHQHEDEIFIIQSGAFEFFANGQFVRAAAGDVVFAPRGEAHSFRGLECGVPNRFSIAIAPGGFEEFYARWAKYLVSPDFTPQGAVALNAEYGIELFPPGTEVAPVENGRTRLVRRDEMTTLDVVGDRVHVALSSEQTGGAYALCFVETPPNGGPPPHVHEREDEIFLIESGEYEFWINGQTHRVAAGDVVFGPRGVPHTFRVVGEEVGRMWVLMTPGGFDSCFAAMSDEVRQNGFSPEVAGQICASFGCHFLPPAAEEVAPTTGASFDC